MSLRDHVCDPPLDNRDFYCSVCGHRIFASTVLVLTSEEIRAASAGLFNYAKATTSDPYRQFLFDLALRLAEEATKLQVRPAAGYNEDSTTSTKGGE